MALVGEGVFETLKVVDSQPFALTRHFARMAVSAAKLDLPVPALDEVRTAIGRHLGGHPLTLGRLRIDWIATRQGAELSVSSQPIKPPEQSVALAIDDWAVDEHGPLAGIKSTRYENFAAARGRAQADGADDAVLANHANDLCETSTANIFYVLDGVLYTPALASGCLPGIARALVIDLCEVVEVDRPMTVLADASEVFLTSSLREVQPVHRIANRAYEAPGPLTTEAMDAWQRLSSMTWDPSLPENPR